MSIAETSAVPLARRSVVTGAQRVAAGRAEWRSGRALDAILHEWRDLSRRALEPNVFYDPAFALAAEPVFGANLGAVLVWSHDDRDRLIGFFPAQVERRYGIVTTLTGWTHPYAPLGTPLVDRHEADAAIVAFLDHVEANARLPKLILLPMVAEGPFTAALVRVIERHGGAMEPFGTHARALLAPATERLNYLDNALGAKKLKELRRQRRRLLDKGQLKTVVAREPEEMHRALTEYLELEAAGWKGRAGSAAIQNGGVRTFIQQAILALAADHRAEIHRIMQNNHPLATAIALRSGDTAWFWKIAYDEEFARYSPGVQMTLDLSEALLADPAIARVDSCATEGHPMIDHLWRERLELSDFLIAPSAASLSQFGIARHLESLRRSLISTAKTLRDGLRR
jgi:CelD/BcsL family acetyltransferase involved in cellulose biosynthesis